MGIATSRTPTASSAAGTVLLHESAQSWRGQRRLPGQGAATWDLPHRRRPRGPSAPRRPSTRPASLRRRSPSWAVGRTRQRLQRRLGGTLPRSSRPV